MNSKIHRVPIQSLMDASAVSFGTSGVRGKVTEMSSEVCFAYTSAFLNSIPEVGGRVALAMDLRPSSPTIAMACAAAIERVGLLVDFCGAIPTPALADYAHARGLPAIMVTGSHIPFDRNGIKFYGPVGEITKTDEANICRAVVSVPEEGLTAALPEVNPEAQQSYLERYLRFFPEQGLSGMRLAVYEHSSVARDILRALLEALGAEVISLGRTEQFVPIDTEAVSEADVKQASLWAEQYGFDAILSADGDGDRPLIGDECGRWLRGDVVGILCAQYLGAQAVVSTLNCNTAVELCNSFEVVKRTRIGSPYVIDGITSLLDSGASKVVGFEPNGGFLLGSTLEKDGRLLTPLLTRDAALPILCLLSMAREKGCKVSGLLEALPQRFTASGRLANVPAESCHRALQCLAASPIAMTDLLAGMAGKPIKTDQTDGLRIYLETDEIVHFRPSGNAPEMRCYAESFSQERAEFLVQQGILLMNELIERMSRSQSNEGPDSMRHPLWGKLC